MKKNKYNNSDKNLIFYMIRKQKINRDCYQNQKQKHIFSGTNFSGNHRYCETYFRFLRE